MKDKLEKLGFNSTLDLTKEEPLSMSRKVVTRIVSGGYAFTHVTGKRASYVKVDRSLLDEFNQECVGNMKVLDESTDTVTIGCADHPEILQFEILR